MSSLYFDSIKDNKKSLSKTEELFNGADSVIVSFFEENENILFALPLYGGECAGDHRTWYGSTAGCGDDGSEGREGERAARPYDQPDPGGDPVLPAERTSGEAASGECEFFVSVYRGRIASDHAGHEGNLRFQRFCLHIGLSGPVPCAAGHRIEA